MKNSRSINLNSGTARGASRSFGNVVDTFVQPAKQTSGWGSLSKALGVTAKALGRQEQLAKEEQQRTDERNGQIAGLAMSMKTDPALIKAGVMHPQASKSFMAGLRQSQSQAWTYQKLREWETDYESWEDKDSNDPAAFTSFMQNKLSEARKSIGDDQFAIAGALPILQQGVNNMSSKHTAYTSERIKSDELVAMQGVSLGAMEQQDWESDPTGSNLISFLSNQTDIRVAKGLDGSVINQTMVDDILAFADAHNDTRYLGALASAHDAGTYRLSAPQMKQVDDALLNIEAEEDAIISSNEAAMKKQVSAAKDSALQAYQTELMNDPMAMPSKDLPQDVYKSALGLRSALNTAIRVTDPEAEAASLKVLNAALYHPDFQKLSYAEKMSQILPLLNNPDVPASQTLIASTMKLIGQTNDPQSPLNNTTITKLRGNAVASMKALSGGISVLGNVNQMSVALQSNYDNMMLGYDLEGKSPIEVRAIHDEVLTRSMMDLLEVPETRADLMDKLEDNPALVRQFGLKDYLSQFYDENEGARMADEVAQITD